MVSSTTTTLLTLSPPPPDSSQFISKVNAVTRKHARLKLSVCRSSRLTASHTGVNDKLHCLSSEFGSLSEPIDRVKRLLHYASLLPPMDRSDRVPENRVVGCATEVWVVAHMDECRRMRFRADSDSEISKGFCWCLVWMLDGAEPEEVLMVENQDLVAMNVGLFNVKARSRVNTWHNVFLAMQKATKDLVLQQVEQEEQEQEQGKPFQFHHHSPSHTKV
ncbi:Fe-S metabolism associated domain, SufE-like [Sesbania bispinosa]|nr:Fe-S metabolism associated domain, SufE-like [Sesbania bispinosa]